MDRSLLVISLALVTMLLVMAWAWYSKRKAQSAPHYFGKPDARTGAAANDATKAAEAGGRPDKR